MCRSRVDNRKPPVEEKTRNSKWQDVAPTSLAAVVAAKVRDRAPFGAENGTATVQSALRSAVSLMSKKSLLRRKVLREPALRASEENVPAIAQAREYEPAVAQGPQGPESTCCWGASRAWDCARALCPCLRVGPRRLSPWAPVPAHKTRTLDRVQRAPPLLLLERCPRVCACAMLAARALAECSRCDRVSNWCYPPAKYRRFGSVFPRR